MRRARISRAAEDFRDAELERLRHAGSALLEALDDIKFNNTYELAPDVLAVAAQLRDLIAQVDAAAKRARIELDRVERIVRLRAARRISRGSVPGRGTQ